MQRIRNDIISKKKIVVDRKMHAEFLRRFSHLQSLLREIKDKGVKEEINKDIEDIKDEIENKEPLRFNTKIVEEMMARAENTLRETQIIRDDYNDQSLQKNAGRNAPDSQLENTVHELAKSLPKEQVNMQGYGVASREYGGEKYGGEYGTKYGIKGFEGERIKREKEFKIVEETMQYGKHEVSKDIYNKEKIKSKG